MNPGNLPRPRLHLEAVDGIRALAAVYVMFVHAWFEPSNGYYTTPIMNRLLMNYGHIAVDVFIVVSGFCLMLPIARNGLAIPSLLGFFRRRAMRILPAYWAALVLSALYIALVASEPTGTVWDNTLPLTWADFVSYLLLIRTLPVGWEVARINYVLWSISVEWLMYLFMPLLALGFRRLGLWPTLALAIGFGLGVTWVAGGQLDSALPWYLGLFASGCAAAIAWESVGRREELLCALGAVALWGVVGLVIIIGRSQVFNANLVLMDTIIGIATALGLVVLARQVVDGRPGRVVRLLSWWPVVWVGGFSYSLYLIHAPLLHILDMAWRKLVPATPELLYVLLLLSTPLLLVAAYGFSLLFERPFLRARRTAQAVTAAPVAEPAASSLLVR